MKRPFFTGQLQPPRRRFVVLAVPRTGSNYLVSLLDSHPDILCHGELFSPDRIWTAVRLRAGTLELGTMAERDRDPRAFLARVWAADLGHAIVGFKLQSWQSRSAEKLVLRDRSIDKIVLTRTNQVEMFVSLLTARQTERWGVVRPDAATTAPQPVTVEVDALHAAVRASNAYYRRMRRNLRWWRQPWLEVSYDQLFDEATVTQLLRFVGADTAALGQMASRFRRQRRDGLRSRIANFDELERALRGTPLHAQLVAEDA